MRRLTVAALTVAAGLALAACSADSDGDPAESAASGSTSAPAASGGSTTSAARPTVVADGLAVPWGMVFLPDGRALVSERDSHRLVTVTAAGTTTAVGTVPGVRNGAGEGGLLGLALSPRFADDRTVFAYYTSASDNRVVAFTFDGTSVSGFRPVFTGIPSGSIHNGGRLAVGPDGHLYVTTGDAGQPDRAPDVDYLGGKVLRMTTAGRPAPGNPDPDSVVWTRGHRNPQGIAFGPDGTVYEAEFGQNSQDEINRLSAGRDYGWPSVEGDNGEKQGATPPLATFSTSDASPSGLAHAGGSLWLAALGGERLYRLPLTGGRVGERQELLDGDYGRLRTVVTAPDGSLWVTTSNRDGRGDPAEDDDRIIRVPVR